MLLLCRHICFENILSIDLSIIGLIHASFVHLLFLQIIDSDFSPIEFIFGRIYGIWVGVWK